MALGTVAVPAGAQGGGGRGSAEQRAEAQRRLEAALKEPRTIDAVNSVWIDELTWMEVRDAIAAGKTTVIIPTGGIEQNGPYAVTGKHNVILRGQCESIAKRLGNALCAPVIAFVPEGNIERKTSHMAYPGTISLNESTYRALLHDITSSLAAHGFTELILIGDSGGNQAGLRATADTLNARWAGKGTVARFIPEFYDNDGLIAYMNKELGIVEPKDDGWHDYYWITALMMAVDVSAVRYDQRVKAGKATINGVSIAPKEQSVEVGKKLMEWRTTQTVNAIMKQRGR
ncbi:MAG TPA: creatininase family protein [Gemmatimonadaceae bacterium]|nr:creatininase family protein [Gemmatimonadaceae bacterium]